MISNSDFVYTCRRLIDLSLIAGMSMGAIGLDQGQEEVATAMELTGVSPPLAAFSDTSDNEFSCVGALPKTLYLHAGD